MKTLFLSFVIVFSSLVTPPAHAEMVCNAVFKNQTQALRADLINELKKKQIPALLVPNRSGEKIPVILVNDKTAPQIFDFLDHSVGTAVRHQPKWPNDHGQFRLTRFFIDYDTPGERSRGEIHDTGISWQGLVSFLKYAAANETDKRIEVAYQLTDQEMRIADLYHRMRRAAILRTRFTFGGGDQDTDYPNFLQTGGEDCFAFSCGSEVSRQVQEAKSRFNSLGLGSFDAVIVQPDVAAWLAQVEEKLLDASTTNSRQLNYQLPYRAGIPASFRKMAAFENLDDEGQMEALNWLIGGTISIQYQNLIKDLGVTRNSTFSDMNNPRVTAILIYDGRVAPATFMSQAYESKGIFSTWKNTNTERIW